MRLVFLGFSCNNHCVFCSQGAGVVAPAPPAAETWDFSADKAVAFVGGEPTLVETLLARVSSARRAGAEWILVQTNARRLCYSDYAAALAGAGVDALDISLQGSTPAMHDYHTQVPGSWAQTIAGMRQADKVGLPFGVSTVITRSNFRHLIEIVRLVHRMGGRALRLSFAENYGRAAVARDRVIPAPELVSEETIRAGREALRLGLGLCVYGKSSSPDIGHFFAGMGEMNGAPALKDEPKRTRDARARPNPGLGERRVQDKISGDALRAIFPQLFLEEERTHG